ncbi:MAG: DinB family protein [Desulfovibrio sp.]|jgi:hypothetical protein|nr:DinB family protein [Desulfovibrio sp.]
MKAVVQALRGPFEHSCSLVADYIDKCPDAIWTEKNGGWPVWQQIAHTLAVMDFFSDAPGREPLAPPCSVETAMLKHQGADLVSKDAMKAYMGKVKARADAWLDSLDDGALAAVNAHISGKMGRDMANGALVVMLSSHTQYHVGSCDAALRDHGLPGVF